MLTNKFKSKAKNIAVKSFMYEIKRNSWYTPSICSLMYFVQNNNRKTRKQLSVPVKIKRLYRGIETSTGIGKDQYKSLLNKIPIQMPYHVKSKKQKNKQDEEYNYLMDCVNSLVHLFFEQTPHNPLVYINERDKMEKLSNIGKTIFIRAGLKIFGENFKLKEESPMVKMPKIFMSGVNSISSDGKIMYPITEEYIRTMIETLSNDTASELPFPAIDITDIGF